MLKVNNNIANNYASYRGPNFRGLSVGPAAAKVLDKVGSLQSPGQRLIFGVSALVLQPVLDIMNPWVDKDTKETSAIRSVAKAIVSTATGVVIREACILGTNAILNSKNLASKLPEVVLKDTKHSAGVIGTLMGLGIMMFTNFLLDAPWTNAFTNMLLKHHKSNTEPAGNDTAPAQQTPPAIQPNTIIPPKQGDISSLSQVNRRVLKWA